jgi:alpha-ribazole phosphatase
VILHLIRHPQPAVAPGVCYGRLDLPPAAADAALEQLAARLRAELPPATPLWTSPLVRCRALAERLHAAPQVDARLQEMDFGAWEGLHWDAIARDQLDAWAADVADYAPPGGESARALQARACAWLAEIVTAAPPAAVAVTHGGVIRVLAAHWLDLPPGQWANLRCDWGQCLRFAVAADGSAVPLDPRTV